MKTKFNFSAFKTQLFHFVEIQFMYLKGRDGQIHGEIYRLLIHFPHGCDDQDWDSLKQEASDSVCLIPGWLVSKCLGIFCCFSFVSMLTGNWIRSRIAGIQTNSHMGCQRGRQLKITALQHWPLLSLIILTQYIGQFQFYQC